MEPMEEYQFDLRGYTHLPAALSTAELAAINGWIDGLATAESDALPGPLGRWYGNVEVHSYYGKGARPVDDGANLQHLYEAGPTFERLLDHPSWFPRVRHYLGRAAPFVNEMFANVRGRGGLIGAHSGGWFALRHATAAPGTGHIVPRPGEDGSFGGSAIPAERQPEQTPERRTWVAQNLSVIVALGDIGPGDGSTVVVPFSHKSVLAHPADEPGMWKDTALLEGAKEVHMRAGDALLFTDSMLHGATARRNAGQRRTVVMRYMPQHNNTNRFGYQPSAELMARLTPARRALITDVCHPEPPRRAGQQSNHSAIEPGGWPAEQVAPFEGRDPYSYVATPAASKL